MIHKIIGKIIDKKFAIILLAAAASFCVPSLPAQQSQIPPSSPAPAHDSMPGMDMRKPAPDTNPAAARSAHSAMSEHGMDERVSADVYMTTMRRANTEDE